MKSTHKWLKAAVATVGAGALTFGGAALAATAQSPNDDAQPSTGQAAVELAAASTGQSVADVKEAIDLKALVVTPEGHAHHIEPKGAKVNASGPSTFSIEDAAEKGLGTPTGGSRPDAPVTIYLDFDGEDLTGSAWDKNYGNTGLTLESSGNVDQAAVWAIVAEDYAPFNVNVTTTKPAAADLVKADANDTRYGSHVIITTSTPEFGMIGGQPMGGIAWINAVGSDYLRGALVFVKGTGTDPKGIANTASHEAGHNFALGHDGTAAEEYYGPNEGTWAPIMGSGYTVPTSQWSHGAYKGASNPGQDDLATITDTTAAATKFARAFDKVTGANVNSWCSDGDDPNNPVPGDRLWKPNAQNTCNPLGDELGVEFTNVGRAAYAADDAGDNTGAAKALVNTTGSFTTDAVIGKTGELDVFKVTTDGGAVTAKVDIDGKVGNLNAKLRLLDANGAELATNSPEPTRVSEDEAGNLGAAVSGTVPAGTFYLEVSGVGYGDQSQATATDSNGYPNYGSLGQYTLSGTAEPSSVVEIAPIAITTPADGTQVDPNTDVVISGTAHPGAEITLTPGDVKTTAGEDGTWSATIKSATTGDTTVVATQTVDGTVQEQKATITLKAKTTTPALAAPVIVYPANGDVTTDTTPTISGTGKPGATVSVTVNAAGGAAAGASAAAAANGTATVDADGNWEWTTAALAAGAYTVSATQALDGQTSAASATVAFTVEVKTTPTETPTPTDTPTTKPTEIAVTGSSFDMGSSALLGAGLLALGVTTALVISQRRKLAAER